MTESQRRLEALYLGLRTSTGIPAELVAAEVWERWVSAGWALTEGGQIRLTAEGWLRLDALVAAAS